MRNLSTTNSIEPEKPLPTSEDMIALIRKAIREIGPPPPVMRYSKYATALPAGNPQTDDMKAMVDRLGQQRVPAAFRINDGVVDMVVVYPDLMKQKPK